MGVEQKGLFGKCTVTNTGCIGPCGVGPVVIVYPDGVWYQKVQPEDVDEICSHMLTLLRDEKMRKNMGLESQQIIASFHPKKTARGFVEAIFELPNNAYKVKHAK